MRKFLLEFVPGLIGGLIGGVVGYFAFQWLLGYGLFAPILPGALTGLGCGLLSRTDSTRRGILCAIEAAVIGAVSYRRLMNPPFETDGTYWDFATKIHKLPPPTLLMLGFGVVLGFWWGRECSLRGWKYRPKPGDPVD